MEREGAAALAADVVGYGGLKGEQKAGTLAVFKASQMAGQDLATRRGKESELAQADPLDENPVDRRGAPNRDELTISFEFFPPRNKDAEDRLVRDIGGLEPLSPRFVSVTYGAGGGTRKNTLAMTKRIAVETTISSAAHLTCIGARRDEVDAVAREFWDSGIRHIVAVRGDPPDGASVYQPHPHGYAYAADMVAGLKCIADFEISVAAYPEIHPEASSASQDLDALKRKLDAGATRAITQFFFDTEVFSRFVERARAAAIDVPIVAGVMPITNFDRVYRFARHCRVAIPGELAALFDGHRQDPATCRRLAIEVAAEQCRQLRAQGQQEFHIYTMNDTQMAASIRNLLHNAGQSSYASP
ncbi:MAG: methylenetetrahydrofolate reductase [NAD(P)H] [Alphaproteobacteria bacterium]|nr:methylenetetrahydrofolate reductase [NAD(P)H] [Alphaproteobacteria bacterium]